jgi:hypothetical protein
MESQINDYFCAKFKEARTLLSGENTAKVAENLESMCMDFTVIFDNFSKMVTLMDNLRNECKDKALEIRDELELKEKYDGKPENKFSFVFQGKYKNMSWGDIEDIEDKRDEVIASSEEIEKKLSKPIDKIPLKKINILDKIKLPKEISIRMVSRLDNLPPAFGWYSGDKTHREGIYIRFPENMFVRIPFPNVIDGTQNYTRNKTIKCKYETKDQCDENCKFLADRYNTKIRECLFAHKGDVYSKVGTNFRCPSNPRFGNHAHLKTDIEEMKADDIKPVLMYALSDILNCFLWSDFHHSDDRIVFSDVEVCQ